jgi:threonine aldolase
MSARIIELRSDTFTKPTPAMFEAMMAAKVGDDVFGEDETVNALEQKTAKLFGMEAAIFCPSGTMTNQLAIRAHCIPGSEVICDEQSHVYIYEGGGIAVNAQSSVKLIRGEKGKITAAQVGNAINNPNDVHQPVTRLVSLENTSNRGGGSIYDFKEIANIKNVCDQNKLKLHLDGARLFNALAESTETPLDYGKTFDSISICLSKGLGCPVGSLLLGNTEIIKQTRRFRKLMGGGWRQAGFLAAAGIYALDHHVERLREDHRRAKEAGKLISKLSYVKDIYPIETNIIIFELDDTITAIEFVQKMNEKGIKCIPFGKQLVRMVTHIDFTDNDLEYLHHVLSS